MSGNEDRRLKREVGVAEEVARLVEPLVESMGYRLVRVRMAGRDLQIMCERPAMRTRTRR